MSLLRNIYGYNWLRLDTSKEGWLAELIQHLHKRGLPCSICYGQNHQLDIVASAIANNCKHYSCVLSGEGIGRKEITYNSLDDLMNGIDEQDILWNTTSTVAVLFQKW
jgi:hypothetical protein